MVNVNVNAFVMFVFIQGAFEKVFSFWPLSKCFELNGNVYEWWFRWKLDRYVCATYTSLYCTFKWWGVYFNLEGVGGLVPLPQEKTGVCHGGLFTLSLRHIHFNSANVCKDLALKRVVGLLTATSCLLA